MKLYLSPSNQPHNAYAVGGTTEKIQMEAVATRVKNILDSEYDCETVMADFNLGINKDERPTEAKNNNADLYLAIHSNATGVINTAAGAVAFYHPNAPITKTLAENLVNKLNSVCPIKPNRSSYVENGMTPFDGSGYGEIRSPMQLGIPSALVEVNFHDNPKTAQWIIDNKDTIAATIAKSIVEVFNIKEKASAPETPTANVLYRVQTGAFSNKANADALLAKVKAAGFDTYMVQSNGLYKVQVGAYSVESNADAMAAKLKAKGFDVFITTESGTPAQPEASKVATITVGSKVKVKQGAKSYTGGGVASFIYDKVYTVDELRGDRAVLDENGICTPFRISDLVLQ